MFYRLNSYLDVQDNCHRFLLKNWPLYGSLFRDIQDRRKMDIRTRRWTQKLAEA